MPTAKLCDAPRASLRSAARCTPLRRQSRLRPSGFARDDSLFCFYTKSLESTVFYGDSRLSFWGFYWDSLYRFVTAPLLIGQAFHDGMFRIKLAAGHSNGLIFRAEAILALAVTFLMYLIDTAVGSFPKYHRILGSALEIQPAGRGNSSTTAKYATMLQTGSYRKPKRFITAPPDRATKVTVPKTSPAQISTESNWAMRSFRNSNQTSLLLAAISIRHLLMNCSGVMAPRSSPLRVRTETVPFSISRSPTTSM